MAETDASEPVQPPRNPYTLLKLLCLSLASVVMALMLAEAVLRYGVLSPAVPAYDWEFQEEIADDWPHPVSFLTSPGTLRILGLSDSFGISGGPANYHYLAEAQLRVSGHPVDLVNFSVAAYELPEELEILKRFGPRYRPDLILHGVFVGNDLEPVHGPLYTVGNMSIRAADGFKGWIPHRWLTMQFLQFYLKIQTARAPEATEPAPIAMEHRAADVEQGKGRESFSQETFLGIQYFRTRYYRPELRGTEFWSRALHLLDAIREEASRQGARYVLVIHPDQVQVELPLQREITQRTGLDFGTLDLEQPQAILRNHAFLQDYPYVDLLPTFRDHGSDGGLYLPRDTHYNDAGNRLASDTIAEFLIKSNLLRPSSSGPESEQAPVIAIPLVVD